MVAGVIVVTRQRTASTITSGENSVFGERVRPNTAIRRRLVRALVVAAAMTRDTYRFNTRTATGTRIPATGRSAAVRHSFEVPASDSDETLRLVP